MAYAGVLEIAGSTGVPGVALGPPAGGGGDTLDNLVDSNGTDFATIVTSVNSVASSAINFNAALNITGAGDTLTVTGAVVIAGGITYSVYTGDSLGNYSSVTASAGTHSTGTATLAIGTTLGGSTTSNFTFGGVGSQVYAGVLTVGTTSNLGTLTLSSGAGGATAGGGTTSTFSGIVTAVTITALTGAGGALGAGGTNTANFTTAAVIGVGGLNVIAGAGNVNAGGVLVVNMNAGITSDTGGIVVTAGRAGDGSGNQAGANSTLNLTGGSVTTTNTTTITGGIAHTGTAAGGVAALTVTGANAYVATAQIVNVLGGAATATGTGGAATLTLGGTLAATTLNVTGMDGSSGAAKDGGAATSVVTGIATISGAVNVVAGAGGVFAGDANGGTASATFTGGPVLGGTMTVTGGLGGANASSDGGIATATITGTQSGASALLVVNGGGSGTLGTGGAANVNAGGGLAFTNITLNDGTNGGGTIGQATLTVNGLGAQAISSIINAPVAGEGTLTVNNVAQTATFSGAIGNTYQLRTINIGNGSGAIATFSSTVNAAAINISGVGAAGLANFNLANTTTGAVTITGAAGTTGTMALGASQTIGRLTSAGTAANARVTLGTFTLTVGTNGVASGTAGDGAGAFGGVISGTGGLTKEGGGTLTLSGANTYTGVTNVNQGSLVLSNGGTLNTSSVVVASGATFDPGSTVVATTGLTGSGSTTVGSGGVTVTVAPSTTVTYAGALTGTGTLAVAGTGTEVLTGTSTEFAGTTNITNGTLSVNGVLGSGTNTTNVNSGNLNGNGTIKGTVVVASGATLSPGNSPGYLAFTGATTVNGNYSPDIDGTVAASTGNVGNGFYDVYDGTGAATLALGTTSVLVPVLRGITGNANNTFVPTIGQGYTIIRTALPTGITGTFSAVTPSAATLAVLTPLSAQFNVGYSGNSIVLNVTPVDYRSTTIATTTNRVAMGTALQTLRPATSFARAATAEDQIVWNNIYGQSVSGLGTTMDQISGSTMADAASVAASTGNQITTTLLERASHNRVLGQTGIVESGKSSGEEGHRSGVWLQPVGKVSTVSDDSNGIGYDSNSYGAMTGVEIERGKFLGGASFGYIHDNINFDSIGTASGNNTNVNNYSGSLYGGYKGDLVFANVTAGYTYQKLDTTRNIAFGSINRTASGSPDAGSVTAAGEVGMTFKPAGFIVEPSVGIQYVGNDRDSFTETGAGALNLNYDSQRSDSAQSKLGARIAKPIKLASGVVLVPEVRAAWLHEMADNVNSITAAFAGAPATKFTVNGVDGGSDRGVIGLGFKAQLTNSFDIGADYSSTFNGNEISHNMSASASLKF